MRATFLTLALGAALAAGCATNPATGKKNFMLVSEEQEIALGTEAEPEAVKQFGGAVADEGVQAEVREVGNKLAAASARPNLPWSFTAVNSPELNAFALPGGKIFITAGLLAKLDKEKQLAGVLGHEVGHCAARHQAQQISKSVALQTALGIGAAAAGGEEAGVGSKAAVGGAQIASQLLMLKYSREAESEADGLGIDYSAKAGYDPRGVPELLTILLDAEKASGGSGTPQFLLTHPATDQRVKDADAHIAQAFPGKSFEGMQQDSSQFQQTVARMPEPAPSAKGEEGEGTTLKASMKRNQKGK